MNVYIMSGVDGVGALPKEQISCKFGLREFDLTINGLNGSWCSLMTEDFAGVSILWLCMPGRNYRLVKTKLSGDIDPSASTFRVRLAVVVFLSPSSRVFGCRRPRATASP